MKTQQWFNCGAAAVVLAAFVGVSAAAAQPPFELAVAKDKAVGATPGMLRFDADTITFAPAKGGATESWRYDDLNQIQLRSSRRVELLMFDRKSWLTFKGLRRVSFDVRRGTISPALSRFLAGRVDRPLVVAVVPESCCPALAEIPVHHDGGSDGRLVLRADALVFETTRDGEARYWRFTDIENVLRLDRFRILVTVREGAATRPFVFDAKTAPPPDFYDRVWAHINDRRGDTRE